MIPWTVARQVPLSMEFSRQEYWTGLPFPSPGDLPDPEIEPSSPELGGFFTAEPPGKPATKRLKNIKTTKKPTIKSFMLSISLSVRLLSQTQLSDFTFTFHFHASENEMATQSSILAWRILGTAEPGGLPSMGSHRVGQD